tara:strand:+ start:1193 stop:1804 length:612 start_codon:yes stop_codon:yes gene_type:complete
VKTDARQSLGGKKQNGVGVGVRVGVLVSYLSTRVNSFNNALVRASPSKDLYRTRTRDSSSVFERTASRGASLLAFRRSLFEYAAFATRPRTHPPRRFPLIASTIPPAISRNSIFIARDRASRVISRLTPVDVESRPPSRETPPRVPVPSSVLAARPRFRRPRSSTPDGVPAEVSGETSVGVRTPGETSSAARFAGDALMRRRV